MRNYAKQRLAEIKDCYKTPLDPGYCHPFWAKVDRRSLEECWPWLAYRKPSGHGLFSYMGTPIHASRLAWILIKGYPKHDYCVLHRCDNSACCNPDHMYLGTRADNMIDLWGKTPAEERGKRGRRTKLDNAELERMWKMRADGALLQECAKEFDVHIATICRYITIKRREKLRLSRVSRFAK